MSATSTRAFEFKDDKSSKFWEVTHFDSTVTVRYGKTGTIGQRQEKVFDDASAASRHVAKLIAEKTGKGYLEVGSTSSATTKKSVPHDEELTAGVVAKPNSKSKVAKSADVTWTKPKNTAQDPEATPENLLELIDKDEATNRLLAKHPRASAELLEKLSHSNDKLTRQGVAANPNTAPEIYVKLGQQFPKEFLANPALDLLLMVHPALLEEVPPALLVRLLKQADCPASLLIWAADHPQEKVQLAVAMNPKVQEKALEKLRLSQYQSVLEAVKAPNGLGSTDPIVDPEKAFEQAVKERLNSMTTSELHEAWAEGDIGLAQWASLPLGFRLAKSSNSDIFPPEAIVRMLIETSWTLESLKEELPNYEAWDEVVLDPKTPIQVIEGLAKDSDLSVRRTIARKTSSSESVLEALAKDKDGDVRGAVAGNAFTSPSLLKVLAKDSDESIRREVARNTSTPFSALGELANDLADMVRHDVASNKSTPASVLQELAKDSAESVRSSVARNSSTPFSVLELLAKDSVDSVRNSVATNTSTPESLLKVLVQHTDRWTRDSLARKTSTPVSVLEVLAKDSDKSIRSSVTGNKIVPLLVLDLLAKDSEETVRSSVAGNNSTPGSILEVLAKDSSSSVRSSVARNNSTPGSILEVLAKDSIDSVRSSVAGNNSTPRSILEVLAKDSSNGVRNALAANASTPSSALEILAKDSTEWVRRSVALHSSTTVSVLAILANDKESGVRAAVAKNHASPTEVLEKLASDRTAEVVTDTIVNPGTPLDALLLLVTNKSVSVRVRLARHAHRSAELCWALWSDRHSDVRQSLLRNQQLVPEFLDEMVMRAELEKDIVALLMHPQLSSEGVQILSDRLFKMPATSSRWYQDELSKADAKVVAAVQGGSILSYFGKDPNKAVLAKRSLAPLMALCSGPFVEPSRIVKVAGSTDWLVRAAVARNPGTPPNLLKKLMADAHPFVAQVARATNQRIDNVPTQDLVDSQATFDLLRATKEVLGRIPCDSDENIFRGCPAQFFTDDVWMEQLSVELMAWMTARLVQAPLTVLPIPQFPPMQRMLNPNQAALLFELAVAFERASGSLGSRARMWAAADPSCPINVLRDLANERDTDIVLAVLGNPTFPPEEKVLIQKRFEKCRGSRLVALLKNESVPTEVLVAKATSKDEFVRFVVAKNPSTPVANLVVLAKDPLEIVRTGVADNPSAPVPLLEELAKDKDSRVRRCVADNPSTPISLREAILGSLAKDKDEWTRRIVADDPSMPVPILELLAQDKDSDVRSNVARNPSTPVSVLVDILGSLAKDKDRWTRQSVADNPSTPVAVLELLSQDKESIVRSSVAKNPSTPLSVRVALLDALAKDKNELTRKGVAKNPSTPVAVLEELAKDEDIGVRSSVAENPSTPAAVLKVLAQDKDIGVRSSVAKNPSAPVSLLDALSKDLSSAVRIAVAINPHVSVDVRVVLLTGLATDSDFRVRAFVAHNPETLPSVLQGLAGDETLVVRCLVARRCAEQPSLLNPFEAWWLARLQRSLDRESRLRLGEVTEPVAHPQAEDLLRALYRLGLITPTDDNKTLTRASRSKDWLTRLGATLHPRVSEGILKLLRKDADPDVAIAASKRAVGSAS